MSRGEEEVLLLLSDGKTTGELTEADADYGINCPRLLRTFEAQVRSEKFHSTDPHCGFMYAVRMWLLVFLNL